MRIIPVIAAMLAVTAAASPALAAPAARRLAAVDTRDIRQDQRIAAGIGRGQIGPYEAAALGRQQAGIDRATDRRAADGLFSARDYRAISARQNHASRDIRRARFNRY